MINPIHLPFRICTLQLQGRAPRRGFTRGIGPWHRHAQAQQRRAGRNAQHGGREEFGGMAGPGDAKICGIHGGNRSSIDYL